MALGAVLEGVLGAAAVSVSNLTHAAALSTCSLLNVQLQAPSCISRFKHTQPAEDAAHRAPALT